MTLRCSRRNRSPNHPAPARRPPAGHQRLTELASCHRWAGVPFYVCNEAFGRSQGWAEGSLQMAESFLSLKMGMTKPDFINQADYERVIAALVPNTEDQRTGETRNSGR